MVGTGGEIAIMAPGNIPSPGRHAEIVGNALDGSVWLIIRLCDKHQFTE